VIFEPAPYELIFFVLRHFAVRWKSRFRQLMGSSFVRRIIPFAIIGAYQPKFTELSDALIFSGVTVFLFFTAYGVANFRCPPRRRADAAPSSIPT